MYSRLFDVMSGPHEPMENKTLSAQHFYFEDELMPSQRQLQSHFWELEVHLLASELLVDRAEGLCLVLNVCLLGLVKVDLEEACSVQADPEIKQFGILKKSDLIG